MELELVIVNKIKQERLPEPVKEIADEDFNLYIFKEKWNIVRALSRLAYYDERRSFLCRSWKQQRVTPRMYIDEAVIDAINRTVLPFY